MFDSITKRIWGGNTGHDEYFDDHMSSESDASSQRSARRDETSGREGAVKELSRSGEQGADADIRKRASRARPAAHEEAQVGKSRHRHSQTPQHNRSLEQVDQHILVEKEYLHRVEARATTAERASKDLRRCADEQNSAWHQEREQLTSALRAKDHEIADLAQRLAALQDRLNVTEKERDELRHLSEHQCPDGLLVADMQAGRFSEVSDSLSEADVQAQVETLNGEVAQLANCIAEDAITEHASGEGNPITPQMQHLAESLLGTHMMEALALHRPDEDSHTTYLQIALQICLNRRLALLIRSWKFDARGASQEWEAMYNQVQDAEGVSVARQWRAMTRRSMRLDSPNKQRIQAETIKQFASLLAAVKVVAHRGRTLYAAETLLRSFGDRIASLIALAMDINESVGFGVASQDLMVYAAASGARFEQRHMTDYWGSPRSKGRAIEDTVAGTCALGLRRRPGTIAGTRDAPGADLVLLPVGVVLCSTLQTHS